MATMADIIHAMEIAPRPLRPARLKEEYHVTCVCGCEIVSREREFACPDCHRPSNIQWGSLPGSPH